MMAFNNGSVTAYVSFFPGMRTTVSISIASPPAAGEYTFSLSPRLTHTGS